MKEKFLKSLISRSLIVIILALCISCKKEKKINEDPLHWSVCMNAPQNYYAYHPMVTVCHKGSLMGGVSTNAIGNTRGWSDIDLGESIVDTRYTPDSLFIEWSDYFDECRYNLPLKLPSKKLDSLFHSTYKGLKNRKERYNEINVGMAPGGRVCIFVNKVEILRAKANCVGKDTNFVKNRKFKSEIDNYWNHHLLDYTLWDKPDSSYELDFGFCSENQNYKLYHSYFITKEGSSYVILKDYFESTVFNKPYGKPANKDLDDGYIQLGGERDGKLQLPVHCKIEWENSTKKETYYSTDVVFPKDFSKRFTTNYTNPTTGKPSNYNRIVFGVEKDGEHCIIWLDGPEKQEKIMRFKAQRGIMDDVGLNSGGYATEVTYY